MRDKIVNCCFTMKLQRLSRSQISKSRASFAASDLLGVGTKHRFGTMARILLTATLKWPAAARLAGAFAALGAEVEALVPRGHAIEASRHAARLHVYHPLAALRGLRRAIEIAKPDLIVPCDDRAVRHLLALQARRRESAVAELIARSIGKVDSYPQMFSRCAFLEAARKEGIRVPDTMPILNEHELDLALSHTGFPAVLKADGTWGGDGVAILRKRDQVQTGWRGLAMAPTRLRSLARAVKRWDAHHLLTALKYDHPAMSLQRFVTGMPATSAIACRDGKMLAAIHMDVAKMHGDTGHASVVRRIDCAEMDEAARRIAARFKLTGLHGLDFMRDEKGVHLIEINPRATQICHLALGEGRDLLAALLTAHGTHTPARVASTASDLIALFPQEWKRDPESPWLKVAFRDMPADDHGLIAALLPATHTNFRVTAPLSPQKA